MSLNFCLTYTTPDNPDEIEEFFHGVEAVQKRKDQLSGMPWMTLDGLSFCASDSNGNEIELK